MNLLKSFSATTGLNPKKSFIYERFYPLDFSKYIVIDTQSNNAFFHYVFWFRVLELIEPYLKEENIKIVHFIEDKKYHYDHCYIDNSASLQERAYILKRSLYFCGSSKLYSLIASESGINQCFLKADYFLDNTLVNKDQIIDSDLKRKAFVNPTNVNINNIRPEEIAKKILKDVIKKEVEFENTISVGKVFSTPMLELIPDCTFKIGNDQRNEIVVRMDYFFDENNLAQQLQLEPISIVTNKRINQNIIKTFRSRIKKIFYKIEKDSDETFLDLIEEQKINYDIITTLDEKDLNQEKIKYFDYKKINKLNILDLSFLDGLDRSKIYFKTNKIVIKTGKTYASKWHCKNQIQDPQVRAGKFQIPLNIDVSFKEEADHFYFLTSEQI